MFGEYNYSTAYPFGVFLENEETPRYAFGRLEYHRAATRMLWWYTNHSGLSLVRIANALNDRLTYVREYFEYGISPESSMLVKLAELLKFSVKDYKKAYTGGVFTPPAVGSKPVPTAQRNTDGLVVSDDEAERLKRSVAASKAGSGKKAKSVIKKIKVVKKPVPKKDPNAPVYKKFDGHRLIDITGKVFGYLTVLGFSHLEKKDKYFWECRCECGRIVNILSDNLKRGVTKSCGCHRNDWRIKDLTGQRFGSLTVLRMADERRSNDICWLCQCDCGKTTIARGKELRRGHRVSCGCRKGRRKKIIEKETQ